jgi:Circularly permutated YpsA SLOG family
MAVIIRVITGGQTGADEAAWRAAKAAGLPTGGWMPKGFITERGPRPEFADLYGAKEIPTVDYAARTQANVADADLVLWFGDSQTPGGRLTVGLCRQRGLSCLLIQPGQNVRPQKVAENVHTYFLPKRGVLMVAGNRESKSPGIGARVEEFLETMFRRLECDQ